MLLAEVARLRWITPSSGMRTVLRQDVGYYIAMLLNEAEYHLKNYRG